MVGDVTVVGLDPSTVPLDDIGMDVPSGVAVTIPADKATLSKDLWRAIGQRRLFQLHSGPAPIRPQLPPVSAPVGHERLQQLESENQRLRNQVMKLEAGQAAESQKLDRILTLLQSGAIAAPAPSKSSTKVSAPAPVSAVVEVDMPVFMPDVKNVDVGEVRMEVQASTSSSESLGSAASALRKMRRGNQ